MAVAVTLKPLPINPNNHKPPTLRTLNEPRPNSRRLLLSRKLRAFLRGGHSGTRVAPDYARGGGIRTLLLGSTWHTLASNPSFVSGLAALALAQALKVLLSFAVERRWEPGLFFSSGGMPSSHSALCTALSTSVAILHGVGDSLFPVCFGFSLIVMYDAIGVRRHAGMQAQVLNKIVEDLFQGHPISQRKLKELLGHTPSQVIAGALLGIFVACFCCQGFVIAI